MRVPEGWVYAGDALMTNYDHSVNQEIAATLRAGQFYADYPGWDFHALCWFDEGKFHAEVNQYQVHVATLSAETPEELMGLVSERFGDA